MHLAENKIIKQLLFITILITLFIGMKAQAVEIMTINEIEPGMKGLARTVFKGYEVEEFPVEIMDIIRNQGVGKNLILIRAGGDKIDKIGGIAAGMSGSPVYINGKLIGAIGYGWNLSDHRFCLVTPIEDMLELFNDEGTNSTKTNDESGIINEEEINLKTPLYVSGMNGRSFDRIKEDFEKYGFEVIQTGNLTGTKKPENAYPLSPGSAVAVQLVRGDINIASVGTITYIGEGDKLLAFGHPFFNKGKVDYLLSEAYINSIIPSLNFPFKLGSPTSNLLGSITIDRGAGIAGKLRKYPQIIPLRTRVSDKSRGIEKAINVQLVKDEDLVSSLVTNVTLQAVDSTLDRIGRGTARVKFKITGNGLPELSVERENVFYSRHDIAAMALTELYQIMDIVTFNPFKEISLIDIQLFIEVEERDSVALVQEARVLNQNIKPGDKLEIEVTIHPYRKKPVNKKYYLQLPDDIEPGMATLVVDGGFTWDAYQDLSEEEVNLDQEINQAIISGYKDFETILDDFLKRPKNNELIMQVYPSYPALDIGPPPEEGVKKNGENNQYQDKKAEKKPTEYNGTEQELENGNEVAQEIKEFYKTDYVLEGSLTLDINIEKKETTDKELEKIPSLPSD